MSDPKGWGKLSHDEQKLQFYVKDDNLTGSFDYSWELDNNDKEILKVSFEPSDDKDKMKKV